MLLKQGKQQKQIIQDLMINGSRIIWLNLAQRITRSLYYPNMNMQQQQYQQQFQQQQNFYQDPTMYNQYMQQQQMMQQAQGQINPDIVMQELLNQGVPEDEAMGMVQQIMQGGMNPMMG